MVELAGGSVRDYQRLATFSRCFDRHVCSSGLTRHQRPRHDRRLMGATANNLDSEEIGRWCIPWQADMAKRRKRCGSSGRKNKCTATAIQSVREGDWC